MKRMWVLSTISMLGIIIIGINKLSNQTLIDRGNYEEEEILFIG